MILHLTSRSSWLAAQSAGEYRAESLVEVGFIHCSTAAQLLPVANAFYGEMTDPVVLWIDPERLSAPLRWEPPDLHDPFSADRFPHLYGPLNLDAVVRVSALERGPDGFFTSF